MGEHPDLWIFLSREDHLALFLHTFRKCMRTDLYRQTFKPSPHPLLMVIICYSSPVFISALAMLLLLSGSWYCMNYYYVLRFLDFFIPVFVYLVSCSWWLSVEWQDINLIKCFPSPVAVSCSPLSIVLLVPP